MNETVCTRDCSRCPAFRRKCEGCVGPCRFERCDGECGQCPVHCCRHTDLDAWLDNLGGLALDVPLQPQPRFRLTPFFPQLQNRLQVPTALQRAPDVAVAVDKVLTPQGQISKRALPVEYGPRNLRPQWGVGTITRLICLGNCKDHVLERLWAAWPETNFWLHLRVLGFDYATSLNFSIYHDDPRMEHLVNIKRTWLTVAQMQRTSALIPIPHLQWATVLDLQRQLEYIQEQGFHTLTLNLQMAKRQTWDIIAAELPRICERAPDLRFLFTGVVSLKRMAEIARTFPGASFTSTTAHHLAQRYIRLTRDGTRLIKEPVEGHPDLILAHNVRLYQEFLAGLNGQQLQMTPRPLPPEEKTWRAAYQEISTALRDQFGFAPAAADDALDLLSSDEAIWQAFQAWLRNSHLDHDFGGSFPTWPCADCVPHPTLGQLLDGGADPLDAFLYLGALARQVDEEIEVFVGEAGY